MRLLEILFYLLKINPISLNCSIFINVLCNCSKLRVVYNPSELFILSLLLINSLLKSIILALYSLL